LELSDSIQLNANPEGYLKHTSNLDEGFAQELGNEGFESTPLFFEYSRTLNDFENPYGNMCKMIRLDDASVDISTTFLPDPDVETPIEVCGNKNWVRFRNVQTNQISEWHKKDNLWIQPILEHNINCFRYFGIVAGSSSYFNGEFEMCFDAINGLVNRPLWWELE
ncbi:hypothetical protein HOA56_03965, partial [archaeon]|nr:hypothetical protein [archaeon]